MSSRSAVQLRPAPLPVHAILAIGVLSLCLSATAGAQGAGPRAEAARLDSVGAALMQEERYRVAVDTLLAAMTLDPARAVTARRLGTSYLEFAKFDEARRWLNTAWSLDTSVAPTAYWSAILEALVGNEAEALRWLGRLPAYGYGRSHAALLRHFIHGMRGTPDAMSRHAADIAATLSPGAYRHLFAGDAALYAGRLADAEAEYRAAIALAPDARNGPTGHFAVTSLAMVLRARGRIAESDSLVARAMELNHSRLAAGRDSHGYPYDIASAYAIQGNRSEAIKWLGKAVDAGWRKAYFTERDPFFTALRGDSGFRRVLRRMADTRTAPTTSAR